MTGTEQGNGRIALMTSTKRLTGKLDKRFTIQDCLAHSMVMEEEAEHIYMVPAYLIKEAEKMGAELMDWRDAE